MKRSYVVVVVLLIAVLAAGVLAHFAGAIKAMHGL